MTATVISVATVVGLALVIIWNFMQSKRVDALQKRVDALEKK
jgi:hypothetical protein